MNTNAFLLVYGVAMLLCPLLAAVSLRPRVPRPPEHPTHSIRCADTPKLPKAWARPTTRRFR